MQAVFFTQKTRKSNLARANFPASVLTYKRVKPHVTLFRGKIEERVRRHHETVPCGNYYIDSRSQDGYIQRRPLTTKADLFSFLSRAQNFPGRIAFEQAVNCCFENSNSPAETNLALLESLKFTMGGMSFAVKPMLNVRIEVPRNDVSHVRYADQSFGNQIREIVEYNGARHEGKRADEDDRRRNELQQLGYTVTVTNSSELFSPEKLDSTLFRVCQKIGTSGRRPANHRERQSDLRALLFELSGTNCWENKGHLLPSTLHPPKSWQFVDRISIRN